MPHGNSPSGSSAGVVSGLRTDKGPQEPSPFPPVGGEGRSCGPDTVKAQLSAPLPLNFPHVGGLEALGPLYHLEFDVVAFRERPETLRDDRRVVNEHVLTAVLRDEAKTLRVVEPLDRALRHCHNLVKMGAGGSGKPPGPRGRSTKKKSRPALEQRTAR